jgi:hypothetical protein
MPSRAGNPPGGIARRLKVGTTRITARGYGSALNHVRGRPASAILDQVPAFVETDLLANARTSDQRLATIVNSEFNTRTIAQRSVECATNLDSHGGSRFIFNDCQLFRFSSGSSYVGTCWRGWTEAVSGQTTCGCE